MTKFTRVVLALSMAAFAVAAFALSDEYVQFAKGPAQFLFTKEEQAAWKNVKSDDEAKAFIANFWAHRDPQFKAEFDERVKYADEHFAEGRRKGSLSDRGHVLIVLGGPAHSERQREQSDMAEPSMAQPSAQGEIADAGRKAPTEHQVWTYEQSKTKNLGVPTAQFSFVNTGGPDWRLERTRTSGDFNAILDRAAAALYSAIAQTATAQPAPAPAPVAATTTTTTKTTTTVEKTTTGPADAVPPAQLKNAAYQAAIDALKGGKSAIDKNVFVVYSELVAPSGEYYIPVELYVPKSSSLTPESADTMFGIVEDANGKAVFAFEEPAKLATSKGEQYVDKTVTLPSGKYTMYYGLAKGDTPVVIASKALDVKEVGKDEVGTSKLVLSNNVFETEKAAPVKSPFAFGRLKIVPKANMAFTTADDLTYFVELHNPGIDPATNLPKIQVKLELSGGKLPRPIPRPLADVTALPLSGTPGPGQYAIIDSIQLEAIKSALSPGDYLLKVKIVDTITKQTYNLEQPFKITS